ncbi:MAG TPA: hypothetical protein VGX70_18015 [Gemmataceae bacterium]|nr:hypothetical protein [Gemmataceae bacterium]
MSASATLPSSLNQKLSAVIRRLRLMRTLRGLCGLVLGMAIFLGLALLLDWVFDLPGEARGIVLAGWLGLGVWLAFRSLILPLRSRPSAEAVAAAIEEEFPQLAERLTTSVELAPLSDDFHGSVELKTLLMAEAEAASDRLNFPDAFPAGRTVAWCSGAVVVILLVLSPSLIWPSRYAELGGRLLMPWQDAFAVPYALEVTPGDTFAAQGRPLTLTARFVTRREGVTLPETCTLVRTDANGRTLQDRMGAQGEGFSLKIPQVAGDFAYHVEAGKATSDTFHVTAVEPVELATAAPFMWQADCPDIMITPLAYARATIPVERVHEVADFSALQHSRVEVSLRFNRPAVAAKVQIKMQDETGSSSASAKPQAIDERNLDIELSADRREGRVQLPTKNDATYRIVLEAEHGILTELESRKFSVRIDHPPKFLRVSGIDEAKEVNPYDRIALDITLADDVGVDLAQVEYRVNQGPPALEDIPLDGRRTQKASARHRFVLAGKVKDGDEFAYRLKATDNRRVPELGLGPNVAYFPAETDGKARWRTFKITPKAPPIAQQDILARRDDINRRLDAIKEDLLKEQRGVYKLRMESRYQSNLMPDQVEDLRQFRGDSREIDKALRDLARTAAESPNFLPLAKRVQDVANREMQNAIQKLGQAEQQTEIQPRDQELRGADRELSAAIRRLEAMHEEADRLAQSRLDQLNLENLADRQEQLAQDTADQIMRDPVKQPVTPEDAGKLHRTQNDLANELQRQIQQSPDLRQALESLRTEQTKAMAERARELAKAQRDLNRAATESEKRQMRDQMANLAKQQRELADKAERLAKETQQPAEATGTKPLKSDSARQAAESLQQGDAAQAMRRQDRTAQELDRMAKDLDKAGELGRQREAARQLAQRQESLRRRVAEEAQNKDPKQVDRLKEMEREQKAIQQAAEKLPLPQDNAPAQVDRGQAVERATKAAEALQKADTAKADSRMTQARQALERLANGPDTSKMKLEPQAQESRRLAQEQRQLRSQVEQLSHRSEPSTAEAKSEQKKQLRRQDEIRRETGDLARDLLPLGQQMPQIPQLLQAFSSEQNARGSMKRAQEQTQAGSPTQAQESRQQAAQSLDQAAQQLREAARQMAGSPSSDAAAQQQTGQALQQAQGQMKQAQNQLGQGKQRPAESAMRQAAQALQKAAQQLAQQDQNQPGNPMPDSMSEGRGVAEGGKPDMQLFGKDMQKYAGKPWGQLPGELRNQIIQDMKARYGEDYARIIKLYFEQIAETKEEKR